MVTPKPDDDATREDFRFLRETALPKLGANYYAHTESAARACLDRIASRIDTLIEERDGLAHALSLERGER